MLILCTLEFFWYFHSLFELLIKNKTKNLCLKYWTLYVYVYLPSYTNSKLIYPRFLWMVRIGGGVFPVIKEPDYLVNGDYRVDKGAAPKMLNCLM